MMCRLGYLALALSSVWIAACDAPRPAEAFTPSYYDPNDDPGFSQKDADADVDVDVEETAEPPEEDGGSPPDDPPASGGDPSDAGEVIVPDADPRKVLEGSYLVRMDNYSTAQTTKDGTTLSVRSRLSNLMLVGLTVQDDGSLLAHETMCDQSYWSSCDQGCTATTAWTTTLDSRMPKFFASRVLDRKYTLDESGSLEAAPSSLALGFNTDEGPVASPQTALPTVKTDARVWHLDPTDSSNPSGVRTRILVKSLKSAPPLSVTQDLDCTISTVQVYTTAFSAQLDLTAKDPLDGKSFPLDTAGSLGGSIDVTPGAGSASFCTKDNLDGTAPSDETSFVRFKRYTGVNCPLNFESSFQGPTTPTK